MAGSQGIRETDSQPGMVSLTRQWLRPTFSPCALHLGLCMCKNSHTHNQAHTYTSKVLMPPLCCFAWKCRHSYSETPKPVTKPRITCTAPAVPAPALGN